jgi:hypothetical protein
MNCLQLLRRLVTVAPDPLTEQRRLYELAERRLAAPEIPPEGEGPESPKSL